MTSNKSRLPYRSPLGLMVGVILWTLFIPTSASSQLRYRDSSSLGTIDAGTTITVRTNEAINVSNSDGRVFSGVVDKDVISRSGSVAIPRGSDVELLVRNVSNNEVALDLDAVTVNGQRFGIKAQDNITNSERREGIGANKRTGKYVGGGALLGAVIGAIAGGGKGAAIGAGAGAAAGAGAQILTRGRRVNVPAESLLTFRLEQPLQTATVDNGFTQDGHHYHPGYGNDSGYSAAYREGLQAGRSDWDRNLARNTRSSRWSSGQQRADYEAGYNRGYQAEGAYNSAQQAFANGHGSINIGGDNNISWQAPGIARVYVQVDNEPLKLFGEGRTGTQDASWISQGHRYIFVLQDLNGTELARDQLDLRQFPRGYRSR